MQDNKTRSKTCSPCEPHFTGKVMIAHTFLPRLLVGFATVPGLADEGIKSHLLYELTGLAAVLWHPRNVVSAFSTNSANSAGSPGGVNIMFIRFSAGQSQSGLERSSHLDDGHKRQKHVV